MITILNFLLLLLTFGTIEIADITYTYVDEYTYETQDGITLIELFGEHNTYEKPNLFDGNLTDNSSRNSTTGVVYSVSNWQTSTNLISIEPSTNYTTSGFPSTDGYIYQYDNSGNYLGLSYRLYISDFSNETFTTDSLAYNIAFSFDDTAGTGDSTTIQLEKGSYATEYFPYGEYKYVNHLANGLLDDYTSWSTGGVGSTDITDGILTFTADTQYDAYVNDSIPYNDGDIIWAICYGKLPYSYSRIYLNDGVTQIEISSGFTKDNTWRLYYGEHTWSTNSTRGRISLQDNNSSLWQEHTYDYCYVINKTLVWGSGNEPTSANMKTWFDLYETAITTDQHEYTYTLNTLTTTEQVLIFVYAGFWFILIKALRGVL